MLQDKAERWRDVIKRTHAKRARPIPCDFLKTEFNYKFFPVHMKDKKLVEFLTLIQGSKSLANYEAKFIELSHYTLQLVPTEVKKISRFMKGLKSAVKREVAMFELSTYAAAVKEAFLHKRNWKRYNRSRKTRVKSLRIDHQMKPKMTVMIRNRTGDCQFQTSKGDCIYCESKHESSQCCWKTGASLRPRQ
eukprot:TRINITY_DN7782_c2_g1_i1.p1 TRINITY_DN7782_c2_g1~~TRINITY_DN7782_c2_g1_i1.p1  ORF type:complete len:191 (-),score=29.33 TRINITY_DN7782_c2_g1_i1:579-1151(-)